MDGLIENVETLWPLSLALAASLGWAAGRGQAMLSCPQRWVWRMPAKAARLKPAPAQPLASAKPSQTLRIKRSRHPFDNMPPVEVVRAQAKAICEAECVWDAPDIAVQITALIAGAAGARSDDTGSDNLMLSPEPRGLKTAA